uniref:Uncharacterized protein n=1 Tax=Oryzias sinensis TaxID=183150 RepID=A0A8C8DIR2_9TELE
MNQMKAFLEKLDLPTKLEIEKYKTLSEHLVPLLERSFNQTLEHGEIPPSWKEAVITVIPKKINSLTCSDYRPISLHNAKVS